MLVVHKGICSKDVRGKLLPRGINQARDLVSSLDAHVTPCGMFMHVKLCHLACKKHCFGPKMVSEATS